MKKIISLFALSLILTSFASAYSLYDEDYHYKESYTKSTVYPKSGTVVTITKYRDYDNDKRYSTYDYRYGYSYRSTEEYFDDYVVRYERSSKYRDYDNEKIYSRYIPYLKATEEIECYDSPPEGKLFYIKCP